MGQTLGSLWTEMGFPAVLVGIELLYLGAIRGSPQVLLHMVGICLVLARSCYAFHITRSSLTGVRLSRIFTMSAFIIRPVG